MITYKVSENMETVIQVFHKYAETTGVCLRELGKQTDLNWLTIKKILNEDENLSQITIDKLKIFINLKKQELKNIMNLR